MSQWQFPPSVLKFVLCAFARDEFVNLKNLVSKIICQRWMPLILLPLLCSLIYAAPEASPTGASDEVFRQLLYLPAPTPRTSAPDEEAEKQNKRPPDFYDGAHVPPDNAPDADLLDYWERWADTSNHEGLRPSDVVRERLLAACEDAPERLPRLLSFMPDTEEASDRIKKLYDAAQGDARFDDGWRKSVREWLMMHSKYFLSDLMGLAQKAKDKDGYIDKDEALNALANVDWESAAPLLQTLSGGSQPRVAAQALKLLYQHAVEEKDSADEEKYRARLQAVAADRNAPAKARDTVIEALSFTEWPGRDEWYLSLFADDTLREPTDGSYLYSPLTTLFNRDPDKWIPVMAKLVESKDPAVRQNAANCLVDYVNSHPRRDAILPVLRWLSDPDWLDINGTERAWFMQHMNDVEIPESVPGLIWIVENEKSNRMWAARTLAHYKDPRAIPALKKALADEQNESYREYIIEGLLASGGITEAEQLSALEAYALKLTTEEGRQELERYGFDESNPLPPTVSIGKYLARQKEPPEALVRATLARVESLQRMNPAQARALLGVIQGWQSRLVDLDMLHRIGAGNADATMIANALERREKLRTTVAAELQSLVGAGGAPQGVAAVLLEDALLAQNILGTGDEATQIALLACARLVQMPLPVAQVGALLRSKNANLSLAAERYLLAEDSPLARELLWEHHPQQAFITGWRENIRLISENNFAAMDKAEEKLRAELLKPEDAPLEIFALLGDDEQPLYVLRVYARRAVYTHYEEARYSERVITGAELNRFRTFVTSNNVAELGPQFGFCRHDCWVAEFLMLKRQRGRRVFSHQGSGAWVTLLANFDMLGGDGAKIHYRLEDEIKGLEVLYADDTLPVKDVWQRGDDLRVRVEREATLEEDKQEAEENDESDEVVDIAAARVARRRRQVERARARISWRPFKDGKLGEATSPPEGCATFDENRLEIDDNAFPSHLNSHLAQAVSGDFVVLAGDLSEGGLWKKAAGQQAVRISSGEGVYANPIVTPDGQWAIAAKAESNWGEPNDVVRFNLKTGREYRVNLPPAKDFEPLMYVAAQGRVLLRRAQGNDDEKNSDASSSPEFYLLDAATGRTQPVTGVFEPLQEEGRGFLQPTGRPFEVWAAIPDKALNQTRVGRYSLKDFSFEVRLVVPHLTFESADMWADEGGAKLYIVYEGQLLRLPLPASPPAK